MVRYGVYFFINLLFAITIMYSCFYITSIINRINYLRSFLFHGNVDPTLLDSRITYECSHSPTYSLSTLPYEQKALKFYEKQWSTPVYEQTLAYSSEFICATHSFYSFKEFNAQYFSIYFLLAPSAIFLRLFRNS